MGCWGLIGNVSHRLMFWMFATQWVVQFLGIFKRQWLAAGSVRLEVDHWRVQLNPYSMSSSRPPGLLVYHVNVHDHVFSSWPSHTPTPLLSLPCCPEVSLKPHCFCLFLLSYFCWVLGQEHKHYLETEKSKPLPMVVLLFQECNTDIGGEQKTPVNECVGSMLRL